MGLALAAGAVFSTPPVMETQVRLAVQSGASLATSPGRLFKTPSKVGVPWFVAARCKMGNAAQAHSCYTGANLHTKPSSGATSSQRTALAEGASSLPSSEESEMEMTNGVT